MERRAHGEARKREAEESFEEFAARIRSFEIEELQAQGSVITLEGADAGFPLKLESLERFSQHRIRPKEPEWLLLSVHAATEERPEQAVVWVSDAYRARFLKLFDDFLERESRGGNPRNQALVANIARVRAGVLRDLWQSGGDPPAGVQWWELWLVPGEEAQQQLARYVEGLGLRLAPRLLALTGRTVAWVYGTWEQLIYLPVSAVPVAEVRQPQLVDTFDDLDDIEQDEYVGDLVERLVVTDHAPVAVCLVDTGVRRTHVLLTDSLAAADMHSVVGPPLGDQHGHGTLMAGLAMYGALDALLLGTAKVELEHCLESVKIFHRPGSTHHRDAYGLVTAQALALPEAAVQRPRAFCLPITTKPDRAGEPSLWSASVDALAAGVDIGRSSQGIRLLGPPDHAAARLIVVSAGNVDSYEDDYLANCDLSPVEDPAQAWNALTVGAYTDLDGPPSDPSFAGWRVLGAREDLSPHSRTSVTVGRHWAVKPDICMEGGNVLTDGVDFHSQHPVLSLATTARRHDRALGWSNATSAATAQASRLAALVMTAYPDYWPETVRGLLVHRARWTEPMSQAIEATTRRDARLLLVRRYGWGVPSEEAVLHSSHAAVTLVTQDEFVPFDDDHQARSFRLHELPWPRDVLEDLGEREVELRVTLSYFIEPAASRRGWRQKFSYQSHALRFDLPRPTETVNQFVRRVGQSARDEEEGRDRAAGPSPYWTMGERQHRAGSLHQDVWTGPAAELAQMGRIGVYPVGGWWKYNRRQDRKGLPVRYTLLVSLRTEEQGVDLYTPIATEIGVPVQVTLTGG